MRVVAQKLELCLRHQVGPIVWTKRFHFKQTTQTDCSKLAGQLPYRASGCEICAPNFLFLEPFRFEGACSAHSKVEAAPSGGLIVVGRPRNTGQLNDILFLPTRVASLSWLCQLDRLDGLNANGWRLASQLELVPLCARP